MTATSTPVTPAPETLLRVDRVGWYDCSGIGAWYPLLGALWGDLWLSSDGYVGFHKAGLLTEGERWRVKLEDVRDVRRPSWPEALRLCQAGSPARLIDARFGEKRAVITFTGITHFHSKGESLLGYVPHVGELLHSAGELKSGFENRGAGKRAKEAQRVWWRILTTHTVG